MQPDTPLPSHPCIGENQVLPFDGFFHIFDMLQYATETLLKPQMVSFEQIWHASRYAGDEQNIRTTDRYRQADPSYPGIIARVKNPANKPYRMLDGRRRMWKLQDAGETEAPYYVFNEPDAFKFFWVTMQADQS